MSKKSLIFVCTQCGAESPQWNGRCNSCGEWNALKEFHPTPKSTRGQTAGPIGYAGVEASQIQVLSDIALQELPRIQTGISEFDRVFGGGLVQGSVSLIGGDPGIGKSSLLLQMMGELSRFSKTLYVTGEESAAQVALRAKRMGFNTEPLHVLTEVNVEEILQKALVFEPQFMVIDSIQTMQLLGLPSAAGSVTQVRECAAYLTRFAKQRGVTLLLVGHVTKSGEVAGPKVLEHIVDAVVYLEGEQSSRYRTLRALKNRFGPVNELGVFAMTDTGMKEVKNPSAIFLNGTSLGKPGSLVTVLWEGSRPILIELQGLVDQALGGNPRRVCLGLEANRLNMLLAVQSRHLGIATYDQDVYLNIVGGVKVTETSADLAVILAVISSLKSKALSEKLIVFGEVGLSGEIRPVRSGLERVIEAQKHGYTKAIVPKANLPKHALKGMELVGVEQLSEALEAAF